jgi:tetratricopeptide (TPR) repeat protein
MVFLKPDGTERDRLVGFIEMGRFLSEADEIVRGQGIVEVARTNLAGHEDDPALRENLGRALVARARYDEALAEFVWCFDKGAKTASYANARRTSLVSEMVRLGESFAPAARALDERRAAAEGAVLAQGATADDARDFAALNRARNEARRTTETFEHLGKDGRLSDDVKEALLDEVVAAWMAERKYALVVETVRDAEARVGKLVDGVERDRGGNALGTAMKQGGTYYEALIATGNADAAGRIADRLIRMQPANTTYVALIERAVRAEAFDAARALVERARTTLTEREQKLVNIAARKIPAKE